MPIMFVVCASAGMAWLHLAKLQRFNVHYADIKIWHWWRLRIERHLDAMRIKQVAEKILFACAFRVTARVIMYRFV